ncbi:MAG: FtsB family cell division protein [Phocaeicola sp.]
MNKILVYWNYARRHKYLVTVLGFLFILVFVDDHNVLKRFGQQREIRELTSDIERYRKQYEADTQTLKELTTNPDELEKIAREKYLMKKPNEDIYIFED